MQNSLERNCGGAKALSAASSPTQKSLFTPVCRYSKKLDGKYDCSEKRSRDWEALNSLMMSLLSEAVALDQQLAEQVAYRVAETIDSVVKADAAAVTEVRGPGRKRPTG